MAYIVFACSVIVSGAILSFIPVDTTAAREDYHYVPSAGDVWGA